MNTRARLIDVARLAGVSTKTASRAFADDAKVSAATREAVREAAVRLGFRPNLLAKNLRTGALPRTVGLVIGDLANPFYFKLAAGIERELALSGMTLILGITEDAPGAEMDVVNAMLEQQVRALIIAPAAPDQSYLERERPFGPPMVFVDRPPVNFIADTVLIENREGMAKAVRDLISRGHRDIAFVASRSYLFTIKERLAGFRQAMLEAGITGCQRWERLVEPDESSLDEAMAGLLEGENRPTAIVAANNRASLAFIKATYRSPSDVAFIGFDDFELADTFGVTVVGFDVAEMGREAARLAVAGIEGKRPPSHVGIPTQMILRGSGEKRPA
ncbi:LacI family transcriptional regulator [Arthrobacter sp. AG258]|uniref:LacI family DNA-binding transcriptional regulator n=1 Tax=Arthrobacter sp. AG258 TaxID=2183899 RepID=UPI00105B2A9F|nr:LacI family DNA-binding transcriptional regulator [Arthrobacter sp. AG258]TDT74659.1 LacI family transcriptional regulator [Arthrobacter sp. AG258]